MNKLPRTKETLATRVTYETIAIAEMKQKAKLRGWSAEQITRKREEIQGLSRQDIENALDTGLVVSNI